MHRGRSRRKPPRAKSPQTRQRFTGQQRSRRDYRLDGAGVGDVVEGVRPEQHQVGQQLLRLATDPGGLNRVALAVAGLGGASLLLGESVVLFLNRVPRCALR